MSLFYNKITRFTNKDSCIRYCSLMVPLFPLKSLFLDKINIWKQIGYVLVKERKKQGCKTTSG